MSFVEFQHDFQHTLRAFHAHAILKTEFLPFFQPHTCSTEVEPGRLAARQWIELDPLRIVRVLADDVVAGDHNTRAFVARLLGVHSDQPTIITHVFAIGVQRHGFHPADKAIHLALEKPAVCRIAGRVLWNLTAEWVLFLGFTALRQNVRPDEWFEVHVIQDLVILRHGKWVLHQLSRQCLRRLDVVSNEAIKIIRFVSKAPTRKFMRTT